MKPTNASIELAVRTLIAAAGDDPDRAGLAETPARVRRAWSEWFGGYGVDVDAVLSKSFADGSDFGDEAGIEAYDGFVALRRYAFYSTCEHHLARIVGFADVVYLPRPAGPIPTVGPRVVGLSKLGRVVDAYARRLQVQERLTAQIAGALERCIAPAGVAVRISAEHQCMTTRGVHRPGCWTDTQVLRGSFREVPAVHNEVTALLGAPHRP